MNGISINEWAFLNDIIATLGVMGVITITVISIVKMYRMRLESQRTSSLTNEDREAIRDLRAAVQRIEERLEALEVLAMEREREEKFGMKL